MQNIVKDIEGFNPCFNGSYSSTEADTLVEEIADTCFNPCFNGSYSSTNSMGF